MWDQNHLRVVHSDDVAAVESSIHELLSNINPAEFKVKYVFTTFPLIFLSQSLKEEKKKNIARLLSDDVVGLFSVEYQREILSYVATELGLKRLNKGFFFFYFLGFFFFFFGFFFFTIRFCRTLGKIPPPPTPVSFSSCIRPGACQYV